MLRAGIRILTFIAKAGVCLLVVALVSGLSYRRYQQHRVAEERAIRSSRGIDALESVRIGGIDQWIHVRGEDTNNPILLFIHGGPGAAMIPLAGMFQGPWEKRFTVVQWDQRGAGKTYAANDRELQRRTMTVARMQQDALEVVNYLRTRFKRDKIFVLGGSWGSILGLWLAHEHPDVIAAYVGVAQAVTMELNERVAYEDALEMARRQNNVRAIRDLESARPDPRRGVDLRRASVVQGWQAELLGPTANPAQFLNMSRLLSTLLSAPEYSLADVYGLVRGQMFSLETLIPQARRLWFENSGHFPFFEEQQRFTDELFRRLLTPPEGGQAAGDSR